MITATSPVFTGKEVSYNRNKIMVHVDQEHPETIHFVDISYLSETDKTGIPVVTSKDVEAAWVKSTRIVEHRKNSWWGKLLAGPLKYFTENKITISILSVVITVVLSLAVVIRIWWKMKQQ